MKSYEIPIEPMGAPRMTRADAWKKRPVVLRYRKYKDAIRYIVGNVFIPDRMNIIFHFSMPKSWANKKRCEMRGKLHRSKPDIDNIQKGLYDALWPENDAGIADVFVKKIWADESKIEVHFMYDRDNK